MILSILAWVLISMICFTWGFIACRLVLAGKPFTEIKFPDVSIICMTGLALTGIITLYLSLWFPIDLYIQLLITVPVIICWLHPAYRRVMTNTIKEGLHFNSPIGLWIFLISLLMILVISTYTIIHPDTLSYHLQSIIWFEKFKAVPGIVHIDQELGLQSLWFCAHALFRPKIFGENYVLFLNGAVLCWYVLFLCKWIDIRNDKPKKSLLAIFLLLISFITWTQVRLTAASASPDFIVTLYILAAAHLFLLEEKLSNALVILFVAAAVLIKLSALPALILAVYLIFDSFRRNKIGRGGLAIIAISIMLLPVFVRNAIASGYILFPSSFPDVLDAVWKQDIVSLAGFRDYIQSYARVADNTVADNHWIPIWWSNLAIADKLLLLLVSLIFVISLFKLAGLIRKISWKEIWLLGSSITGILIWWIFAPDPRFGHGFLLLVAILLARLILQTNEFTRVNKIQLLFALVLITGVIAYTGFRFARFFEGDQIVYPKGAKVGAYSPVNCSSVMLNKPVVDTICSGIPAPCILDSCNNILPIGSKIEDGFTSSKKLQ